jgi:hypothetical protein
MLPQKVSYSSSSKRFFTHPKHPEQLWTNPTPYSMHTGIFPLEVKCLGCEPDLLAPSCAEAKNTWNYTSTSICFHGTYRNKFTFAFYKTNFTAFHCVWYSTQHFKE